MAKYYAHTIPALSRYEGLGKELESELLEALYEHFRDKGDRNVVRITSGTDADLNGGTDALIWGVPCDITYNYLGKDHMEQLPKTFDLFAGTTVRFGVRTGNSHNGYTPFADPVLVIGIDGADDRMISTWMVNIVSAFKNAAETILDLGQSQYWDWMDAHAA